VSIEERTFYIVECDANPCAGAPGHIRSAFREFRQLDLYTEEDVEPYIRKEDWKTDGHGQWFCPDCVRTYDPDLLFLEDEEIEDGVSTEV